uniref:Uncharacterized protein n=1 Tax=candidate division CPR3 bacterium TaxID=2268181 RepID=A0A7C4RA68_UNCC3
MKRAVLFTIAIVFCVAVGASSQSISTIRFAKGTDPRPVLQAQNYLLAGNPAKGCLMGAPKVLEEKSAQYSLEFKEGSLCDGTPEALRFELFWKDPEDSSIYKAGFAIQTREGDNIFWYGFFEPELRETVSEEWVSQKLVASLPISEEHPIVAPRGPIIRNIEMTVQGQFNDTDIAIRSMGYEPKGWIKACLAYDRRTVVGQTEDGKNIILMNEIHQRDCENVPTSRRVEITNVFLGGQIAGIFLRTPGVEKGTWSLLKKTWAVSKIEPQSPSVVVKPEEKKAEISNHSVVPAPEAVGALSVLRDVTEMRGSKKSEFCELVIGENPISISEVIVYNDEKSAAIALREMDTGKLKLTGQTDDPSALKPSGTFTAKQVEEACLGREVERIARDKTIDIEVSRVYSSNLPALDEDLGTKKYRDRLVGVNLCWKDGCKPKVWIAVGKKDVEVPLVQIESVRGKNSRDVEIFLRWKALVLSR